MKWNAKDKFWLESECKRYSISRSRVNGEWRYTIHSLIIPKEMLFHGYFLKEDHAKAAITHLIVNKGSVAQLQNAIGFTNRELETNHES